MYISFVLHCNTFVTKLQYIAPSHILCKLHYIALYSELITLTQGDRMSGWKDGTAPSIALHRIALLQIYAIALKSVHLIFNEVASTHTERMASLLQIWDLLLSIAMLHSVLHYNYPPG